MSADSVNHVQTDPSAAYLVVARRDNRGNQDTFEACQSYARHTKPARASVTYGGRACGHGRETSCNCGCNPHRLSISSPARAATEPAVGEPRACLSGEVLSPPVPVLAESCKSCGLRAYGRTAKAGDEAPASTTCETCRVDSRKATSGTRAAGGNFLGSGAAIRGDREGEKIADQTAKCPRPTANPLTVPSLILRWETRKVLPGNYASIVRMGTVHHRQGQFDCGGVESRHVQEQGCPSWLDSKLRLVDVKAVQSQGSVWPTAILLSAWQQCDSVKPSATGKIQRGHAGMPESRAALTPAYEPSWGASWMRVAGWPGVNLSAWLSGKATVTLCQTGIVEHIRRKIRTVRVRAALTNSLAGNAESGRERLVKPLGTHNAGLAGKFTRLCGRRVLILSAWRNVKTLVGCEAPLATEKSAGRSMAKSCPTTLITPQRVMQVQILPRSSLFRPACAGVGANPASSVSECIVRCGSLSARRVPTRTGSRR